MTLLYPARAGTEFQPGSNAWVVSGKLTASGKPILANDPHLEWSIPAAWYQVHLKAPGLDVTGVSLPGVPCVIHRPQPAHRLGRHQSWVRRSGSLHRKDRSADRPLPVSRAGGAGALGSGMDSREGRAAGGVPAMGDAARSGGFHRKWPLLRAALGGGGTRGIRDFLFSNLNRAGNWKEFTAALARYPGPGQNFVYADVDGNIGYQAAGMLPIRKNFDGDVPVDGASGRLRMGWLHSFRSIAGLLQSAARMDRDRESESVSRKLSVPRERGVWRAISIERRFATGCWRAPDGSRKKCWAWRRMFTPAFSSFLAARRLWRHTIARNRPSRNWLRP